MKQVRVIRRDSHNRPCVAAVQGESHIEVVAERTMAGWRATHGLNPEGHRLDLPRGFELNPESLKCLDDVS